MADLPPAEDDQPHKKKRGDKKDEVAGGIKDDPEDAKEEQEFFSGMHDDDNDQEARPGYEEYRVAKLVVPEGGSVGCWVGWGGCRGGLSLGGEVARWVGCAVWCGAAGRFCVCCMLAAPC